MVISFSLKPLKEAGRTFENAILPVLEKVAAKNPPCTLFHGHMPRHVVERRGLPTNLVDALDRLWPDQRCFYNEELNATDRAAMIKGAKDAGLYVVFVIGPIVEGVAEEVALYNEAGMLVKELEWEFPE